MEGRENEWPPDGHGSQHPARNDGHTLQVYDQRFPVTRSELTTPVQENQDYLGQAAYSIPQQDGDLTIHDRMPIQQSGIQGRTNDKQRFCDREAREKTYRMARNIFHKVSPKSQAENGFYFTGQGDEVRCFCCGTSLREWEPNDDPLIEHIKYGPDHICPHLLQTQDEGLLRSILEALKTEKSQKNAAQAISRGCMQQVPHYQQVHGTASNLQPATGLYTDDPSMYQTACSNPGQATSNRSSFTVGKTARKFVDRPIGHQYLDQGTSYHRNTMQPFMCPFCKENKVDHVQLHCGHGICWECIIYLEDEPMTTRKCFTCKQSVVDYVPWSPGCGN